MNTGTTIGEYVLEIDREDGTADVIVFRCNGGHMPNGIEGQAYWGNGWDDDDRSQRDNTDACRWPPDLEPLRRAAAEILGLTAPPIRPETMEPDDPRRPQVAVDG